MKLVIDASVWVSAFVAGDVHHAQADQLLETCLAARTKVIVPEIVLLEVAAGVARILRHDGTGQVAAKKVEQFPGIKILPIHTAFLNKAIIVATRHFLRAADALYVTAARVSKGTLITLDDEMLHRAPTGASISTPAQCLETFARMS